MRFDSASAGHSATVSQAARQVATLLDFGDKTNRK